MVGSQPDQAWPVWGHDHVVRELQAAVRRGPRHAYILSGFDHLGKTTIATEFAAALICPNSSEPGVACRVCSTCTRVFRGSHPDVDRWDLQRQAMMAETSASKQTSLNIATVRQIGAGIALRPMESAYRVVIVDDVETMQGPAQEAFLKTLEEPPPYVVILLLTTDAALLLPTILSRAVTLNVQSVPVSVIEEGLTANGLAAEDARVLAEAARGRPGWAITAAGDRALLEKQQELQHKAQAWVETDRFQRLADATVLGDGFTKDRDAVFALLAEVQGEWRRRLLSDIDTAGPERAARSLRALKSIESCMAGLDANVRPRLALQDMVLQWPEMDSQ